MQGTIGRFPWLRDGLAAAAAILLVFAVGAGQPRAAGTEDSPAVQADPDWTAARTAIEADRFDAAIPLLRKVVARDDGNADAYNYLGYANSRLGRHDEALAFYRKALAIEPEHLGANEYLGELFLKMGDVAAAEERLEVLDGACFFGCEEYRELKEAIADFKATGKYVPHKED